MKVITKPQPIFVFMISFILSWPLLLMKWGMLLLLLLYSIVYKVDIWYNDHYDDTNRCLSNTLPIQNLPTWLYISIVFVHLSIIYSQLAFSWLTSLNKNMSFLPHNVDRFVWKKNVQLSYHENKKKIHF